MRKPGTLEDLDEVGDDAVVLRALDDLTGIAVDDASGIHVGQLAGTVAEAETGLLRYVDLALATRPRHVLVPIGHVRVREREGQQPHVRLRAALLEDLEAVPPYAADVAHITDPFERELLAAYGRTFHGERYYAHPAYDHDGLYVGEHPVIGPQDTYTSIEGEAPPLCRMADLPGWRVAEGEPDVRGWTVRLRAGEPLEIADLIVDRAAEAVRYVVVRLSDSAGERLLPIGYLRIDWSARAVEATPLTAADVAALPRYDGGAVARAVEERMAAALRERLTGQRRYQLPDYRPGSRQTHSG